MSLNNEYLSGNPNMQLGGLLAPWPSDEGIHIVEEIRDYRREAGRVLIRCGTSAGDEAMVALTPLGEHLFRLTLYPAGVPTEPRETPCLVGTPEPIPCDVTATDQTLTVSFGALVCEIDRRRWELVVRDRSGTVVCREHRADTNLRGWRRASWLGYRRNASGVVVETFEALYLAPDEQVYGLGEKFMPPNRRGQRIECWNFNTWGATNERAYKNVPFAISTAGYGLFLNTTFRATWDIGSGATSSISTQISTEDDRFDLFVIHGPALPAILERYTALTGRPPIPPRWSFGYWQSKYGYTSWDEVWEVVRTARELRVPVDVIHLDPYWQRNGMYADLVWDEERFPDPVGNMARLREQGIRVCLWLQPWIPEESEIFTEGREFGAFASHEDGSVYYYTPTIPGRPPRRCGVVDFSSPTGREWYIRKILGLIAQGVSAFKTDFGEAIPEDAVFANGMRGWEMHNQFPLLYNAAFYEAFERSGRAGDLVCWGRSGWAGIQRYPVSWSGDMLCNFPSMACTLWSGLSFSLSGVAFWSHDIGGFMGETNPELYVRWAQWGLLCSHSRGHGTTAREPWAQGETALRLFRQYDELRYRLIPYLYSLAHEAHRTGQPILRPLVLDYQGDPNVYHLDLQYLLGPSLLVAPIFEAGATERTLYLPHGLWYDFWTGQPYEGGRWVTAPAPIETLPLFVKAGAILPFGPAEQYVGELGADELTLRVYPENGRAAFALHEDGGTTRYHYDLGALSVEPSAGAPATRTYRVVVADEAGPSTGSQAAVGLDEGGAATHRVTGAARIDLMEDAP
ncbi:MAG: glycoside hydrolase family 31 protein [Chloroflexi bacterium]|nr:glycoside hydrolase family 31 protein [Chloroflexota bacterium]